LASDEYFPANKESSVVRCRTTMCVEMVVNAKLVEDGWAWHFKKYNSDERLAKLEETARTAKRGLWADEAPLAPWDFRGGNHERRQAQHQCI
jgi:endonuclease YncB( thermonuclease family)